MESKMAKKKQQNVPISYDMWYKQPTSTIIQSWSKPKICLEWSWVNQKITLQQWTHKSCINVSDLDVLAWSVTVVSLDLWNIITIWTDWWAFLDITWLELSLDTSLVYQEPNQNDSWLLYTNVDWVSNFIKLSHTEVVTPTALVQWTINHWLNSTRVYWTAYDTTTWWEIDIEFMNRTANTIDYISTTNDQIEIIIKK